MRGGSSSWFLSLSVTALCAATTARRGNAADAAGGDVVVGGDLAATAAATVTATATATATATDDGIPVAAGRTTTIVVEPELGRPLERDPLFVAHIPSYRRAAEMDGALRWFEADALYQQALGELGAAAEFLPGAVLEPATLKIEQERRRSRALAQSAGRAAGAPGRLRNATASRSTAMSPAMPPLERGRLLRLKLMAVRAVTGTTPGGLVSATLGALTQALGSPGSRGSPDPVAAVTAATDDGPGAGKADAGAEVRLLLCATRAAAGDRRGARLELAHVRQSERLNPARAMAAAVCHAALGDEDRALASLAVALFQLGPSTRALPGQTREIRNANDWDRWRGTPPFERLFR